MNPNQLDSGSPCKGVVVDVLKLASVTPASESLLSGEVHAVTNAQRPMAKPKKERFFMGRFYWETRFLV